MLPMLLVPALVAVAPKQMDTPPFVLVTEYIRELWDLWAVQYTVDADMREDKANPETSSAATRGLATGIRNSTRIIISLRTNIRELKQLRLTKRPFDTLLDMQARLYQQKIERHEELKTMSSQFLAGLAGAAPPGLDLTKILKRFPEITAELEDIDRTCMQLTILWFGLLVDDKADSLDHCSHMVITRAQRDELVHKLDQAYGTSMETDKRFNPASASILKFKLLEFKCADDPWE